MIPTPTQGNFDDETLHDRWWQLLVLVCAAWQMSSVICECRLPKKKCLGKIGSKIRRCSANYPTICWRTGLSNVCVVILAVAVQTARWSGRRIKHWSWSSCCNWTLASGTRLCAIRGGTNKSGEMNCEQYLRSLAFQSPTLLRKYSICGRSTTGNRPGSWGQ